VRIQVAHEQLGWHAMENKLVAAAAVAAAGR
jgi:hypothetical protein